MGLTNSLLCRGCGVEDETSAHFPFECEVLVSFRHVYLGFLFLDPENIMREILGSSVNLAKEQTSPNCYQIMGYKGTVLRPRFNGTVKVRNQ
jgi:hypothetical protein